MISICQGIFLRIVMVLALTSFGYSNATSQLQRIESIPANHNPRYKPNFGIQTGNAVAPGRIFVPAPGSVAASTLILESHHEVAPVPVTRFAVAPTVSVLPTTTSLEKLATAVQANPVLAALLISSLLSVNSSPKPVTYNTPEHLPPDPYVALLLSNYGRYVPRFGLSGHGLYGYNAANNIHNTKPFGNYKIYDDSS